MSTFGERLNQWLIEQGREPWPQYLLDALDVATAEAEAALGEREKETVAFVQEIMATWQEEKIQGYERGHRWKRGKTGCSCRRRDPCQEQQEPPS